MPTRPVTGDDNCEVSTYFKPILKYLHTFSKVKALQKCIFVHGYKQWAKYIISIAGAPDCLCECLALTQHCCCATRLDPTGRVAIGAAAEKNGRAAPYRRGPSHRGPDQWRRWPMAPWEIFHVPVPPQWRIQQLVALLSTPPRTCHTKLGLALWQT